MLAQELTKILKRKPAILDRLRRPKTTRRLFTDLSGFLATLWPQVIASPRKGRARAHMYEGFAAAVH